ncbi:Predicted membrane protein [Bordetella pertussis]|nr:Predicted membrane protein [Bordetella pertussis]
MLSASYAAALLLAMRRPAGARLARWLAPAGRMALTNYLLQSLVCAVLFTAWGLRWVGTLAPLSVLGLAVLVFALQLPDAGALAGMADRAAAAGRTPLVVNCQ